MDTIAGTIQNMFNFSSEDAGTLILNPANGTVVTNTR
jgi:hypothetical protein